MSDPAQQKQQHDVNRCTASADQRPVRLAWVVSTPTPYKEPFFEALAARDEVDLHVMFLRWDDPQRPWELDEQQRYHYTALRGFGIRRSLKRKSYLRINFSILGALRRNRSDAVVVCGYDHPTLWFAMLYCLITRTPFLQQGESHTQKPRGRLKEWLKRRLLFPVLRRSEGAFATGKGARDYWKSVGIPAERIYTVANTPNVPLIQTQAQQARGTRDELRLELGCDDRRVAIFVGRFDRVKGIDVLMDALRQIPEDDRPMVWLVGDGPLQAEIDRQVEEHRLPVKILGFRQPAELPKLYVAADYFVLPSRHEPWGVVVNEAMACGLPLVLSSQVGAGFDLLQEGENLNGFSFKSESSEDLAQVLARMSELSISQLQAMGQASERLIAHWTPDESADNVVSCLSDTGISAGQTDHS